MEPATPVGRDAWRLELFASRTGGGTNAAIVSPAGRLLGGTLTQTADGSQQIAAVAAGLIDFARAAGQCTDAGQVQQVIVELACDRLLVLVPLNQGDHLVVLSGTADREQLAFDLCRLVEHLNQPLLPEERSPTQPPVVGR